MSIGSYFKRPVLRLVESLGYVILKRNASDTFLEPHPSELHPVEPINSPDQDGDRERECEAELSRVAKFITDTQVVGDIVDCGSGDARNLGILAAALVGLGDVSRRLILLDTTVDPAHRAGSVLPLWGSRGDQLWREATVAMKSSEVTSEPLPAMLLASGYPLTRITVVKDVSDRQIKRCLPDRIAMLILTCDTYKANVITQERLMPSVSKDGIIVVVRNPFEVGFPSSLSRRIETVLPDICFKQAGESLWIGSVWTN